jgi:hypothetical protein
LDSEIEKWLILLIYLTLQTRLTAAAGCAHNNFGNENKLLPRSIPFLPDTLEEQFDGRFFNLLDRLAYNGNAGLKRFGGIEIVKAEKRHVFRHTQ